MCDESRLVSLSLRWKKNTRSQILGTSGSMERSGAVEPGYFEAWKQVGVFIPKPCHFHLMPIREHNFVTSVQFTCVLETSAWVYLCIDWKLNTCMFLFFFIFQELYKFDKILNLPKVYTNDIHAMARSYGIEAANRVIIKVQQISKKVFKKSTTMLINGLNGR